MTDNTYQLIVRKGPRQGHVFELTGAVLTIGRDPLADIVIDDPEISRQHARFTLTDAGYQVQDLGSTNGTYVDGKRLSGETVSLAHGQIVMVGSNVTLAYEAMNAAADPMATMVAPAGFGDFSFNPPADPEPIPPGAEATAMFYDPIVPSAPSTPEPESFPAFASEPEPFPSFDSPASNAPEAFPSFGESEPAKPASFADYGTADSSATGLPNSSGSSGGFLNGPNRNIIIGVIVAIVLLCCCCLPAIYYAATYAMNA